MHSFSSSSLKLLLTWPIVRNLPTFHFEMHNIWSILLTFLTIYLPKIILTTTALTYSRHLLSSKHTCNHNKNSTPSSPRQLHIEIVSLLSMSEFPRTFKVQITRLHQTKFMSSSISLGIFLLANQSTSITKCWKSKKAKCLCLRLCQILHVRK